MRIVLGQPDVNVFFRGMEALLGRIRRNPMAQYAVINHPDVATAGAKQRDDSDGWSPRMKLACFLAAGSACWAVVLAPFFLLG